MTTLLTIAGSQKAARQSLLLKAVKLFMVALIVTIAFKTTSPSISHHLFHNSGLYSQTYSEICENNSHIPDKDNPDHVKMRCCSLCLTSSSSDELRSLIAIIPRLLQVISIRVFANEIGGNPETLIIKFYSISNIRRPRGPPYSV
jgi:hypothetical protein